MKNFKKKLEAIVIFLIVWIILNENIYLSTIVTGIVIAMATLKLTNVMLQVDYAEEFYEPPKTMVLIFWRMMKAIYVSGWDILLRIVKGNVHPTFYRYKSKLTDPLSLTLLSNRITLPPGSATISRVGSELLVLFVHDDIKAIHEEIAEIEERVERYERSRN